MSDEKKAISSFMTESRTFPPPPALSAQAYIKTMEEYEKLWRQSLDDPDGFWLEQAKSLSWFKFPTKSLEYTWDTERRIIEHTWFKDG